MTDLMHADAIQQLEVALLGSPAVEVVASVLMVGVSEFNPILAMPTVESKSIEPKSDKEILTTLPKSKASNASVPVSKCHHVATTLISPSVSTMPLTSSIASFPVVVVPELVILAEVCPECLNRPGGGEDYLCHLCHFTHSNLDSILCHVRKHLDVTIGCPVCGRGYQNVASSANMAGMFIIFKL